MQEVSLSELQDPKKNDIPSKDAVALPAVVCLVCFACGARGEHRMTCRHPHVKCLCSRQEDPTSSCNLLHVSVVGLASRIIFPLAGCPTVLWLFCSGVNLPPPPTSSLPLSLSLSLSVSLSLHLSFSLSLFEAGILIYVCTV